MLFLGQQVEKGGALLGLGLVYHGKIRDRHQPHARRHFKTAGTADDEIAGHFRVFGGGDQLLRIAVEEVDRRDRGAVAAPKAAANLDALLAMQGIEEDPVERRKRSVQRGKRALDVLDDLKIGLLSGNFDTSTVSRLRDAAANLKSPSGDPGLDKVLSEIELRVEVELAKAGQF